MFFDPILLLWFIPSFLALGMVAYVVKRYWEENQEFTLNQLLLILVGFLSACLPIFSLLPLVASYLIAQEHYGFGNRPLIVSREKRNERLASRLRGDH